MPSVSGVGSEPGFELSYAGQFECGLQCRHGSFEGGDLGGQVGGRGQVRGQGLALLIEQASQLLNRPLPGAGQSTEDRAGGTAIAVDATCNAARNTPTADR